MIDLLRAAADDNPHIPAYRAVLALCAAEGGDRATAQALLTHFAGRAFELPPDSNWLLGMAVLADAAATLHDRAAAGPLYELLVPWAGRHVVLNCYGGGGAYWGPIDHHLGRLAALCDRPDEAAERLERAVEQADAYRAPLFAQRSRAALDALR
jgi:hypothetical protein